LETASAENKILRYISRHRDEIALLLSDEVHNQLLRVARRVQSKDWAGLLLSYLWKNFTIHYIVLDETREIAQEYVGKIPREDLFIFITALIGHADCFVSRNREILRAALGQNPPFQCFTPEEFLNHYEEE